MKRIGTPSRRALVLSSACAVLVGGVVLAVIRKGTADPAPAEIAAVFSLPPRIVPVPHVFLGRATFSTGEQIRVMAAIDRLLRHRSELCGELARSAWHRWLDDRISNGRGTSLCPASRFGYMAGATAETYLCGRAFESEEELIATLAHEERHHLRPDEAHRRSRDWDGMCPLSRASLSGP